MTEFKATSGDKFGFLGFIAHLFIALGALIVVVGLFGFLFTHDAEQFGLLFGIGGAGVLGGVGIGFLNILLQL